MLPSAFDALAPNYDHDFTESPIARHLRARVHADLTRLFPPGSSALELGCGTGEDALFLAARGVRVRATDSSEGMLAAARAKTADAPLITLAALDLAQIGHGSGDGLNTRTEIFDGVYSNFGVLNCLPAWDDLARWLATRLRPGGTAAFGLIAPRCLWETLWHGAHGDSGTAFRRWRGEAAFRPPGAAEPISITYPTIARFERAFTPYFERTRLAPLGVFLPPTDAYGMIEKRPRLLRLLTRLDDRFRRTQCLAAVADHFWIEFVRR